MYRDFQRNDSQSAMTGTAPQYQPDEPAALTLLQYMNREQLQQYVDNSSRLDDIIKDLNQVKEIQRDRENVVVKNKSLAEYNVSLRPKFESLKQELGAAYEIVNDLKLKLGTDVAKLDSSSSKQSPDTILAILQTESATADEDSEKVAEDFCEGKVEIDSFISDYLTQRTEAFVKKAKSEKLAELIRQEGHGTGAPSVPYSHAAVPQVPPVKSPVGYSAPYPAGSAPYPSSSSYGMPAPFTGNYAR